MGAPLPAGSSQVLLIMSPSQQLELVLGRLWLYERKLAVEKSLSLPVPGHRCVHRRGNRNASCSAGVAWSESVAGKRLATEFEERKHERIRKEIEEREHEEAQDIINEVGKGALSRFLRLTTVFCSQENVTKQASMELAMHLVHEREQQLEVELSTKRHDGDTQEKRRLTRVL
ncbi:hypothetical protein Tco_0821439 [Tanacetum coccineum]|uniref:Uncharacterized protein n=1 Tax=Tanacetum coccineum TaxID=301880 RepID=A0ABQ5AC94_9ASTR